MTRIVLFIAYILAYPWPVSITSYREEGYRPSGSLATCFIIVFFLLALYDVKTNRLNSDEDGCFLYTVTT